MKPRSYSSSDGLCAFILDRAFPDDSDLPAEFPQGLKVSLVPLHRLTKLRLPEPHVGCRRSAERAVFVPMPEAAVHLYGRMMSRQQDVWTAGKPNGVEAVTQPQTVQGTP